MLLKHIFLTVFILKFTTSSNIPSYIHKCSISDPKLNLCIVINGNKAIPEIAKGDSKVGIPNLKPYKLKKAIIRDDQTLKFILKNVQAFGIENCRLLEIALTQGQYKQILICPKLVVLGDYDLNGWILTEFVYGTGKANITIANALITSDANFVQNNDNAVITQFNTIYNPQRVFYSFQNLYNGNNDFLGYLTNIYLNNNWFEVSKLFRKNTTKYISDFLLFVLQKYADAIKIKDGFLP